MMSVFICFYQNVIGQSSFSLSYLGNFRSCQLLFFFGMPSRQRNNLAQFAGIFTKIGATFFNLYNLHVYLWPNYVKSMCRILKIITFLKFLSQGGWFDISARKLQLHATSIFQVHSFNSSSTRRGQLSQKSISSPQGPNPNHLDL